MEDRNPVKKTGAVLTGGLVLLAGAGIFTALDRSGGSLGDLMKAAPLGIAGLLAATAATYAFMSERFRLLSVLSGIFVPARLLHELGFASSVMGRVIFGGGMAGNVFRIISLRRRHVPVADTVAASVAHGYVNFIAVGAGLALAIVCMVFTASVTGAQVVGATLSLLLLAVLTGLFGWALVNDSLRRKLARKVMQLIGFVARRDFSDIADRFDTSMDHVTDAVRQDPHTTWRVTLLALAETASATAALWFSFLAFGVTLGPWEAVAIFGLSTAAGAVSMLPGGLGVQDGSITGIAMMLGVEAEAALMAALLFRVMHFFLPFAVSLFLYRRLLSSEQAEEGQAAASVAGSRGYDRAGAFAGGGAHDVYLYEEPELTEYGPDETPVQIAIYTLGVEGIERSVRQESRLSTPVLHHSSLAGDD